jgi:hypothetical protein
MRAFIVHIFHILANFLSFCYAHAYTYTEVAQEHSLCFIVANEPTKRVYFLKHIFFSPFRLVSHVDQEKSEHGALYQRLH